MVECNPILDLVFQSLADSTRRDIVNRVAKREQTISELATDYHMSFAAVAKHIAILQEAQLVTKRKRGKERLISAHPAQLKLATDYLKQYEDLWSNRFNKLDALLKEES